jgi:hypothetical protein
MLVGVTMIGGGALSAVAVAAIFIPNIPEGLSSSAGMKKARRPPTYVVGLWGAIAVVSGLAAILGFEVFNQFSAEVIAATMKWVSTNPSLGAGKSSLDIGAPPHPLIAAAGRRLP